MAVLQLARMLLMYFWLCGFMTGNLTKFYLYKFLRLMTKILQFSTYYVNYVLLSIINHYFYNYKLMLFLIDAIVNYLFIIIYSILSYSLSVGRAENVLCASVFGLLTILIHTQIATFKYSLTTSIIFKICTHTIVSTSEAFMNLRVCTSDHNI